MEVNKPDDNKPLLLNFKDKSCVTGVTRGDLKKMADQLGLTDTATVHIAMARLYQDLFPEQMENSLPTQKELQDDAAKVPPNLKVTASLKSLFGNQPD